MSYYITKKNRIYHLFNNNRGLIYSSRDIREINKMMTIKEKEDKKLRQKRDYEIYKNWIDYFGLRI